MMINEYQHTIYMIILNVFAWPYIWNLFIVISSAGIGRTGTYIAIDVLFEAGKIENKINIAEFVKKMRRNRMNMVQTYVSLILLCYLFIFLYGGSWCGVFYFFLKICVAFFFLGGGDVCICFVFILHDFLMGRVEWNLSSKL